MAKILLPLFRKKGFRDVEKSWKTVKISSCAPIQRYLDVKIVHHREHQMEKESFCKILFSELSRSSVCSWNGNKKKFETGSCNVIIRKLEKRHCQLLNEIYANYQKSKNHRQKLWNNLRKFICGEMKICWLATLPNLFFLVNFFPKKASSQFPFYTLQFPKLSPTISPSQVFQQKKMERQKSKNQ